jgi:hypothetical protein
MTFKLNPHTLIFIENYVIYYSYFLSPVRYNHFEERAIKRKMSQVQPRENSLSKESRVQPSVIKMVSPLMRNVINDMSFDTTTEAVVKAVEITERAFARQMSGGDKKKYAKELLSGIVKEIDPEENNLDDIIDLVVSIAKNKDLHKLFKRSSVFCLACCKNDKD